jgi:hypothetical protein
VSFSEEETARLARLAVATWPSQALRKPPHVLSPELAHENLQADVRKSALSYFDAHGISWWLSDQEREERKQLAIKEPLPTGHLNSSQIACLNHLEPARLQPEIALVIARNLEPRVAEVRQNGEGGFVEFEWIGKKSYLTEPGSHTRGANVTSLDALMCVTLDKDTPALLVIEWKYTENYGAAPCAMSSRRTDRVGIYRDLIEADDSPFVPGDPARLFYEPYYQLMRQTLLAARAIADPDRPEKEWIHVHVIPERNGELRRRVEKAAPLLIGTTLEEAWRSALKLPDRYRILAPSAVVSGVEDERWRSWRDFLCERYLT